MQYGYLQCGCCCPLSTICINCACNPAFGDPNRKRAQPQARIAAPNSAITIGGAHEHLLQTHALCQPFTTGQSSALGLVRPCPVPLPSPSPSADEATAARSKRYRSTHTQDYYYFSVLFHFLCDLLTTEPQKSSPATVPPSSSRTEGGEGATAVQRT